MRAVPSPRRRTSRDLTPRAAQTVLLCAVLSGSGGCEAAAEDDAGIDAAAVQDDAGLDAHEHDAGPALVPWPDGLSPLSVERRGFTLRRAIVHAHSPLSHDACDGAGWVDGALADEECFAHLRDAVCRLHLDTLWLTDHAPHVNETSLEGALWAREPGDELVRDTMGRPVAARWSCPDSHRVLVMVGSENELMPVGLLRHPTEDPEVLADPERLGAIYEADGADAAAALRAAGAVVLYAHTEGHPLEQIRGTRPDGIEIYNTHANVDPNIREEHLGLGRLDYAPQLLRFSNVANRMEPDLALLSFLSPNENALDKWDTVLAEGMHVFGTGGCDAHENTFGTLMPDGERGDSYRRMMYWHTHHLLVRGEGRDAAMEALGRGRLYLTFEVFGTPVGFDFVGEGAGPSDPACEMGDTCPVGTTLRLSPPDLPTDFPREPPPTIRYRILRAADGGAIEVASATGTLENASEGGSRPAALTFVAESAGAYRAEVHVTPHHAGPYLGREADTLVRDVPWVYSNPIYVAAP